MQIIENTGRSNQQIRRADVVIGVLFLVLVGIVALPLWSSHSLPVTGDGPAHMFRAFAFDRALRQGVIYPRWLDDLAFGLGYPNLNFYPPFTVYITETFHLLGLTFVQAINSR